MLVLLIVIEVRRSRRTSSPAHPTAFFVSGISKLWLHSTFRQCGRQALRSLARTKVGRGSSTPAKKSPSATFHAAQRCINTIGTLTKQ